MPAPRPFREIFVHSPQVEGVHLRFGPVARGGLRWSDRPQDFRTEVLGLVKAQQVKNAVIVPVGAKGGFVPMRLPRGRPRRRSSRPAGRPTSASSTGCSPSPTTSRATRSCRRTDVVRHDGDDPYLVVAADKGTATFSDTANGIALKRGFWLGDAFASGGSAGYDHKAMGITARGAWEAVKRHFREMDVDIQSAALHGRRRRRHVGRRVRQRHAAVALHQARRRLRPSRHLHRSESRSGDVASRSASGSSRCRGRAGRTTTARCISKGGGIFSRAEKQIALSPEMHARLLKLNKATARPAEILSAILKAPVDLLWFGGIGTYVRGPDETNADVGDKANDAIRISATEIGAKVVGEGANLGMTPKARIAYGLKGGRCNSDAIDNSAGVNTSDVEVNIKIALAPAVRERQARRRTRASTLLREMTDDVAALVLRNNYQQTLAISLEERRGARQPRQPAAADGGARGARPARPRGRGSARRRRRSRRAPPAGTGLTRAEIGTLLAFAKIALSNDLVASAVPDDPYLARELFRYFPDADARALRAPRSRRIACAARSSPRSSRTRSSIAAGRRCSSPRATAPARPSPS